MNGEMRNVKYGKRLTNPFPTLDGKREKNRRFWLLCRPELLCLTNRVFSLQLQLESNAGLRTVLRMLRNPAALSFGFEETNRAEHHNCTFIGHKTS